jgi:hypothetical protein
MAWLPGYARRRPITIQQGNLDSSLSNFPLYVFIDNDSDMSTALATGYDVRFTMADGETTLYYERESWSGGGGSNVTAVFWVNVPTIAASPSAATVIYIYWEKAGDSDGQSAANVWDSNFVGRWGMADDPDTSHIADSTSYGNDGTKKGANEPAEASGKVYKAQSFDHTDDYINVGTGSGSLDQLGNTFTLEAIVYFDTTSTRSTIYSAGYTGQGVTFAVGIDSGGQLDVYYPGVYVARTVGGVVSYGAWYYVSYTRTGTGSGTHEFRVNGAAASLSVDNSNNFADTSVAKYIGYRSSNVMNGDICEVRVSKTNRTAAWRDFTYHNIFEADNELTWGSAESGATNLTANDATHAHSADSPAITQVHALSAEESSNGHAADSPAITQVHVLAGNEATHSHSADSPAITQVHSLSANGGTHAHGSESPQITQEHELAPNGSTHGHTSGSPVVTQQHEMTVNGGTHGHTSGDPAITQEYELIGAGAVHGHSAGSTGLTQLYKLIASACTHSHSAGSPTCVHVLRTPGPLRRGDPGSASLLHRQSASTGGCLHRGERTSRPLRRQST